MKTIRMLTTFFSSSLWLRILISLHIIIFLAVALNLVCQKIEVKKGEKPKSDELLIRSGGACQTKFWKVLESWRSNFANFANLVKGDVEPNEFECRAMVSPN